MIRVLVALLRCALLVRLADAAGPTLEEIRRWPAAVTVPRAAIALGISRSHGYDLLQRGQFPAKTIQAGSRHVVITADLVRLLSAAERGTDAV